MNPLHKRFPNGAAFFDGHFSRNRSCFGEICFAVDESQGLIRSCGFYLSPIVFFESILEIRCRSLVEPVFILQALEYIKVVHTRIFRVTWQTTCGVAGHVARERRWLGLWDEVGMYLAYHTQLQFTNKKTA